ncbi:MAG TPA: helix-turn-helix transcriptional regulator [Anaerolineales bacterium]|nr:helix-turn-helix transcriptional regulator [Anaerolineales bacterium]
MAEESIGKRIAGLRQAQGWTQQNLAARLALSRVAVSHIEMDLSIPGERTITLLAGLFKMTPFDLVDGTTYPQAKTERLPEVTCIYTASEMEIILLENDLAWLKRLAGQPQYRQVAAELWEDWNKRWGEEDQENIDEAEKSRLLKARQALSQACR